MIHLLGLLCGALLGLLRSSARREAEILVLRHQINVLRRIRQYGPVATAVLSTNWESYWKIDEHGAQNSLWYNDFPDGVFKGHPSDPTNPGNTDHIVAIVGWDDTAGDHGVWIIKNSWGPYWGDGGYMKLSYGSNNIGFGAAWVAVSPASGLSPSLAEALQIPNQLSRFGAVKPR
jgi:hypothetical protein